MLSPTLKMHSPGKKGAAALGWQTLPAPQPPPMDASPHALPRIAHEAGGTVAVPPVDAHDPPVTVGAALEIA